jgi:hypothetical protein
LLTCPAPEVDLSHFRPALADNTAFIETVREKHRDRRRLSGDGGWLAYLKSRLMVQSPSDEEPSGEMMAALLQFGSRLEAYAAFAHKTAWAWVYVQAAEPITIHRAASGKRAHFACSRPRNPAERVSPTTTNSANDGLVAAEALRPAAPDRDSHDWVPMRAYLANTCRRPSSSCAIASSFCLGAGARGPEAARTLPRSACAPPVGTTARRGVMPDGEILGKGEHGMPAQSAHP